MNRFLLPFCPTPATPFYATRPVAPLHDLGHVQFGWSCVT